MAANLIFVPGKTAKTENPILNGLRFSYNSKKNDRVHWRCAEYKKGCNARIDPKRADEKFHLAKKGLKRQAVETDLSTKILSQKLYQD